MNCGWLRLAVLGGVVLAAMTLPSCGHDQTLESIKVSPRNSVITGAGLDLQYTALGYYSHPPETKDITSTVIWKSQADQIIAFETPDKPGLATSQSGCGTNLGISATVYSNPGDPANGTAVVGSATVTVNQVDDPNCP
jgi:hypothetical protein